jgi:hypothetical protein
MNGAETLAKRRHLSRPNYSFIIFVLDRPRPRVRLTSPRKRHAISLTPRAAAICVSGVTKIIVSIKNAVCRHWSDREFNWML